MLSARFPLLRSPVFLVLFFGLFVAIIFPSLANARLDNVEQQIISESEEPLPRRIYSYDIGIDSRGDVHLVYSKPRGEQTADIIYQRRVAGVWQQKKVLTANGYRASVSTYLSVGNNDHVYICFIKNEGIGGNLYYITLKDGAIAKGETFVDEGGWHTRMQLDENDRPLFIRDNATWPELESKLALCKTTDGQRWDKTYLDLPPVNKFRIADFIYRNGVYHITYGDYAETRPVIEFHYSTNYIEGEFHNLHYAKSFDGVNWLGTAVIDSSTTLYEKEFWTSLVVDEGKPVAALYKYNEYGGKYATGTSAVLMKYDGSSWSNETITDTEFPNSREGMGVGLAVYAPGDYFGAWNYSPDYLIPDDEFHSKLGNTVLARGSSTGEWPFKGQMAPLSLEGRAKLKIHNNSLFFLGLLNFKDVKLYFQEYKISYVTTALADEAGPAFGQNIITPILQLLLK